MADNGQESKNRLNIVYRPRRQQKKKGTRKKINLDLQTGQNQKKSSGKKGLLERFGIGLTATSKNKSGKKASGTNNIYEAPSVMVRGVPVIRSTGKKSTKRNSSVRRRYDVKVPNVPDASMTMPAFPEIKLSWRLLSFLIVVGLSFTLYFLWSSPIFVVRSIEINGLQRIKPYDVNAVLGVSGIPSFLIDQETLAGAITAKFPAITEATVKLDYPNELVIDVKERVPALAWSKGGRTDLVDMGGVAFPLQEFESELYNSNLPVVEASGGFIEYDIAQDDQPELSFVDKILSVFKEEEPFQKPGKPRQIITPEMVKAVLLLNDHAPVDVPLLFLEDHGFAWEDQGGWMVYFGDADQIEMKLRIYQTILRYIDRNEETPELVSVEWVDAPYYRLER